MDPLSISTAAAGLATLAYSIVHRLKHILETMKKVKPALRALAERTERMRLLLDQVKTLMKQARAVHADDYADSFKHEACEKVLKKIDALVENLSKPSKFGDFGKGAEWLYSKENEAKDLIAELEQREGELRTMLLIVCT